MQRAVQHHPASGPVILTWIPDLPKYEHHDDRHEPTLIAAARSQMTASSPRGTFSQAELSAFLVITRCITRNARVSALTDRHAAAASVVVLAVLGFGAICWIIN